MTRVEVFTKLLGRPEGYPETEESVCVKSFYFNIKSFQSIFLCTYMTGKCFSYLDENGSLFV